MLTAYCPKCGGANAYAITKPKFCGQCATPFDAAFANITPKIEKPSKRKRVIVETDEDEEENENFDLPEINKIAIDLDVQGATGHYHENETRQETRRRLKVGTPFGAAWGENEGKPVEIRRKIDSNVKPEKILAELKKESISSRESIQL